MKKFLMGLLFGLIVGFASITFASESIQAIISKSIVILHINGEDRVIDQDDVSILNYQDRIYVPLRVFAERIGATVHYSKPSSNGDNAKVDITHADNRDLTLIDQDQTISAGHLKVIFHEEGEPSSMTGTVKLLKQISEGEQAVIEIYDKGEQLIAVTGYLTYDQGPISEWKTGAMGTFVANFPYIAPVEDYSLKIKLVDEEKWQYHQVNDGTIVDGAGGISGYPLAMSLHVNNYEPDASDPIIISATIMNLSDLPVRLSEPVVIHANIYRANSNDVIWSGSFAPLSGTLPGKKATFKSELQWDLMDNSSQPAEPGDYTVSLALPVSFEGTVLGEQPSTETYLLEQSLSTMKPLTIK